MSLSDPILITGCARSGTSLTAGIIHGCGAKAGEIGRAGDHYNPTGYYENHSIIDNVDKRILRDLGYDPMGQVKLPDEHIERKDISDDVFKIAIEQGIRPGDKWYYKDAKLLLLFGSYIKSFPRSKIVLVRRKANDIIASCMRTPFMAGRTTPEQWLDWVEDHERLMNRLKFEHAFVMELWYEDLINGNYGPVKHVVNWLGLEYDEKFINSIIIKRKL